MSDRKPTQLTHDLRLHCSYTLPGTYRPHDRPFWHVTCSSNFVYKYFMSILTRTFSPPDPTGTVLSDHQARLARYIQRARRAGCSGFIPAHAHLPEPARLARRPVWHATPGRATFIKHWISDLLFYSLLCFLCSGTSRTGWAAFHWNTNHSAHPVNLCSRQVWC